MTDALNFVNLTESQLAALGDPLAQCLPAGMEVALCGPVGAGKTRLVQAVAKACGVPKEDVTSPTFVLLQEYHGTKPIYHFDVYRVADDDEFLQLGPDEYFDSAGITFIEWADRVIDCLPRDHVRIDIELASQRTRNVTVRAVGQRLHHLIDSLRRRGGNVTRFSES